MIRPSRAPHDAHIRAFDAAALTATNGHYCIFYVQRLIEHELTHTSRLVLTGFTLADLFPSSRLARAFSGAARRADTHAAKMSALMNGVIEEHRARRSSAASAGDEEKSLLDVLLRIQTDGGLHVPLEIGTIRAVITVTLPSPSQHQKLF
jgi:hypothetical protein